MIKTFSQTGNIIESDVIVIGTGLAGLHYCGQLLKLNPKIKIALISKTQVYECNTRYAQGGIAAVFKDEDSVTSHVTDTLKAGDGLCYKPAVEDIIKQGGDAIAQLEKYNVSFSRDGNNNYALAREGGHSHLRIFNCGDKTGLHIADALMLHVLNHPQINLYEYHIAINLITNYHPHDPLHPPEVHGAYILDCLSHKIHTFLAKCVILATGGAGKTYRYTSNPMVATGDGVAMAYRAGARVGNMEFYQFHPTILYHHDINNFLISETVRGEGALLKNADTQEKFMCKYAPLELELASRDKVSRAIFSEIEQSNNNFVYLDITHKSKKFLKKRFPAIFNTLNSIGIDMSQDMIPVVPGAHYQCGGVLANVHGQTDLKRLYAIGEVAFSGLHGANRLPSNSLLEAVVMGANAAKVSLKDLQSTPLYQNITTWNSPGEINERRASQINAHWRSLRGEMTSYAGIVRTEAGLTDLLALIIKRREIIQEYYWKHFITRDFIELRNIILNAELIVRFALARRESRGGHYREDYPTKTTLANESITKSISLETQFV